MDKSPSNFCQTMQKFALNEGINAYEKNLMAILSLTYGIPLILLNILVIVKLFMNRKKEDFSSPFYVLFIMATILVRTFRDLSLNQNLNSSFC